MEFNYAYSLLFVVAFSLFAGCAQQAAAEPQAIGSSSPSSVSEQSSGQSSEPISEDEDLDSMVDSGGSEPSPDPVVRKFTMQEIALHSTPSDCYAVIAGKVYNLSNSASKHPGGERIYDSCGTDGTYLFENRPGTGEPHSEKARGYLKNYELGVLQE